jgi:hypothetical protein
MESDNIYNKIMELFGRIPENYSILEEQIDIKTQMAYFERSKNVKENRTSKSEILARKDLIFNNEVGIKEKMEILTLLATLDDVESFRIIEKFLAECPSELKDWTTLALQESRMTIESSLLDENQVIISTGLGGKGKKLRYFTVLASKTNNSFTDLQKKLIKKELEFSIMKQDGEIEDIQFYENYSTFLSIVPLNVSIKELVKVAIDECNQIGDFISPRFILTNVKILSIEEIKNSWNNISD